MKKLIILLILFMSGLYANNQIIVSDVYSIASLYLKDYTIKGNGEKCKITYTVESKELVHKTCIELTNSKGVKIFCTPGKKVCKTKSEITELFGADKIISGQATNRSKKEEDKWIEINGILAAPSSWAEPVGEPEPKKIFGQNSNIDPVSQKRIDICDLSHSKKFSKLLAQDYQGNMTTINSIANDIIFKITEEKSFLGLDPNQIFLGMTINPSIYQKIPMIKIGNAKIATELGLSKNTKFAKFSDFFTQDNNYKIYNTVTAANRIKASETTDYEKEIIKIDERVNLAYMTYQGSVLRIFPNPNEANQKWSTPLDAIENFIPKYSEEVKIIISSYFRMCLEALKTKKWDKANLALKTIHKYQQTYTPLQNNQIEVKSIINVPKLVKQNFNASSIDDNINFIKNQYFNTCPNANIGTVIDNFLGRSVLDNILDNDWNAKLNDDGTATVTAKGRALFMNTEQDIIIQFQADIRNNTFVFNKLLINDQADTFFSDGLLTRMCEESHGEERIEDELPKLKSMHGKDISQYLFKYMSKTKYSPKERVEYYSKYFNTYVELPMTIYSIEKQDTNIYSIAGYLESSDKSIMISVKLYTENEKQIKFLQNYTVGEDADLFTKQQTILIRGKYKVSLDDLFNEESHELSPAILILK